MVNEVIKSISLYYRYVSRTSVAVKGVMVNFRNNRKIQWIKWTMSKKWINKRCI